MNAVQGEYVAVQLVGRLREGRDGMHDDDIEQDSHKGGTIRLDGASVISEASFVYTSES
jgi:hypothetical protein